MTIRTLTLTAIAAALLSAPAVAQTPPAAPTPDPARVAAFEMLEQRRAGAFERGEDLRRRVRGLRVLSGRLRVWRHSCPDYRPHSSLLRHVS
jgi:hypothetical protein